MKRQNIFKKNISTSSEKVSYSTDNIDLNKSYDPINTWDQLEIPQNLLRGIYAYGFENPSPIQQKAIQPMIDGRDVIAQAQSGTGKTATFAIGGLAKIDLDISSPQILCLSPTRELTSQSHNVVTKIGSMMDNLKTDMLVGGTPVDLDLQRLKKNHPHFLLGCPGRVFDVFRRNKYLYKNIKMLILDEADEMLSSGFEEQVYNIYTLLPKNIQVVICSATLPVECENVVSKIVNNPIKTIVKAEQLTLEGIKQYYVACESDQEKYLVLKDLYSSLSLSQSIIYTNSIRRVEDLYQAMKDDGFPVCCIHSNMNKNERQESLNLFKGGTYRVLISSNVTARGIDIQQVSIVINFDIPRDVNTYLHRIGRSGRWGRKGTGINLITRRDIDTLKNIEKYYQTQIEPLPEEFVN